jgi:hypothetical protein
MADDVTDKRKPKIALDAAVVAKSFADAGTTDEWSRCCRCLKVTDLAHRQNCAANCKAPCILCDRKSHRGEPCPDMDVYPQIFTVAWLRKHMPEAIKSGKQPPSRPSQSSDGGRDDEDRRREAARLRDEDRRREEARREEARREEDRRRNEDRRREDERRRKERSTRERNDRYSSSSRTAPRRDSSPRSHHRNRYQDHGRNDAYDSTQYSRARSPKRSRSPAERRSTNEYRDRSDRSDRRCSPHVTQDQRDKRHRADSPSRILFYNRMSLKKNKVIVAKDDNATDVVEEPPINQTDFIKYLQMLIAEKDEKLSQILSLKNKELDEKNDVIFRLQAELHKAQQNARLTQAALQAELDEARKHASSTQPPLQAPQNVGASSVQAQQEQQPQISGSSSSTMPPPQGTQIRGSAGPQRQSSVAQSSATSSSLGPLLAGPPTPTFRATGPVSTPSSTQKDTDDLIDYYDEEDAKMPASAWDNMVRGDGAEGHF